MSHTLATSKIGQKVVIDCIKTSHNEKCFLLGIGVLQGDVVEILGKAPCGGPLSLFHQSGVSFALRKSTCSNIMVKSLEEL